MFKRVMLLALLSTLALSLVGCGSEPAQQEKQAAAAPAPAKKAEEPAAPLYEITKESITSHPDWTSRNVSILGTKIGDTTNKVVANFGKMDNTRTLADEYLTIYQGNGLFVYTQKLTGKIKKYEVYDTFAKQIVDEKLKKLVTTGDLKYMREAFGQEEKVEQNDSDPAAPATEYVYDAKGFRFVQFKVGGGRMLNALRFSEVKKGTT
jgi:PBP1b-binding outer membrane lipoprotein LpoB